MIAEIAIIVSIISVLIAGLSLGWNIYRDIIIKPKVKIKLSISTILQQGTRSRPEYVSIEATNFGPGVIKLSMIEMKNSDWQRRLLRKEEYAVVIEDYTNPISAKLPNKLDVGDKITLLLPYDQECLLNRGWSHVGIRDYFGCVHWASSKEVKSANQKWQEDFGEHN